MLNEDYRDVLSAFSEEGVSFLLVDAFAMAAHEHPRATGDIDLWVRPTAENARRVLAALANFGAPLHNLTAQDLRRPDTVFQIGVTPRRIDILTSIDGVDFEEAWTGRLVVSVSGMEVPVIGREHLIQNKRTTGRPKDLVDVITLEEGRAGTLGNEDHEKL